MSLRVPHFTVASAYQADLANTGVERAFSAHDGDWLDLACVLTRATALADVPRWEYLATWLSNRFERRESLSRMSGPDLIGDVVDRSIVAAIQAQDHDAFATGMIILDLARMLTPLTTVRLHGRMITQQARILRNLGELNAAHDLYEQVARLGQQDGDAELYARANVGLGILARMRGNYPESRRCFEAVLAGPATTPELLEQHNLAKHGLVPAAAVARDFASALVHAWDAYRAERPGSPRRTEMLINIANLCRLIGELRASLNAYLTALASPLVRRLRLTACSGAALVAAKLGDRAMVVELSAATERLLHRVGHEHEAADAERALAEAWFTVGDDMKAEELRARGIVRARNRYHEVEQELLELRPRASVKPPPPVSGDARRVSEILAVADSRVLLATASALPDW